MLDKLRDVSRELSRRRYAKGYIPFNMPETEFIYDDEGKITELKRSEETESHKIVENCMLLANEYVAQKLHKKLGKGIYRVHEEPDTSSLEKILKLLAYYRIKYKKNLRGQKLVQNVLRAMPTETYHKVFDPLILRSMKKARYDIEPLGHFGLASQNYTHFTSPIRRISDLAVHRLLRENFWRKSVKPQLDEKTLKKIADKASEREQLADTAEREVSYQFKKIFMKDKVGEEFEGIIVNLTNNNIMVELDEFPVTGIIPINTLQGDKFSFYQLYMELTGKRSNRIFRLMDRLRVRVERIDYDLIFSLNEKVSD